MATNYSNDGYSWTGDGKLVCPQEADTRLGSLPEHVLRLVEVTGSGCTRKEESNSRYAEYAFKPVSQKEKEKIILAHAWASSVKDVCSRILGVDNHHQ